MGQRLSRRENVQAGGSKLNRVRPVLLLHYSTRLDFGLFASQTVVSASLVCDFYAVLFILFVSFFFAY